MMRSLLLLCAVGIISADDSKTISYQTPEAPGANSGTYLQVTFDDGKIPSSFVKTSGTKQDADASKYSGEWAVEPMTKDALVGDHGLVLKSAAKHAGLATNLENTFRFDENDQFVVQYEVNFQDGIECGGAYVKLFADEEGLDLTSFHDKTRFSIMFGPDKCASDYKLHFILNFKNPVTGEYEEKHLKTKPDSTKLKEYYTDAKPHLYKLVLNKDNTFTISVDNKQISSGSLTTDMDPPINPPKEITDTNDSKPEDWDDQEKIDDPEDSKPSDWDEEAPQKIVDESASIPTDWREDLETTIDDPEAVQPDDWDEEMDGEYEPPRVDNPECKGISGCGAWEPPMIPNPAYKGTWRPKKIDNPDYQGVWKARTIDNPDYFEDDAPFDSITSIKALGLELWSMSKDIYFDNFLISNSDASAKSLAVTTFALKGKQALANAPSLLEKANKATEGRPWIWGLAALFIGLPLIYFLYAKFIRTPAPVDLSKKDDDFRPESINEEAEEEEEEEEEDDDSSQLDDKLPNSENLAAGEAAGNPEKVDNKSESSTAEESEKEGEEVDKEDDDSLSDDELPTSNVNLRKRTTRRAD